MSAPVVLVVSHPNVVTHNQTIYLHLARLGWDVQLIVPAKWVDEYTPGGFVPKALPGLEDSFTLVRVARPGVIQRHFYLSRPSTWLRRWRPAAVFLEQEPFSVPALQWGIACQRMGIPWGVQGDENLDRPFPWPARVIRSWVTPRANFFAARSPNAGRMLEQWGARAPVEVVPHTLPDWPPVPHRPSEPFTVGFAGRLVPAKGIVDLLDAVRMLDFDFRLLVVGDGPMREQLESADLGRGHLELHTGVRSDAMPGLYGEMDALVLPSRTTEKWAEQFGKVLGEALLCGVPVVGSSSGEIPWVIETTGGGVVFPEGDAPALAAQLSALQGDPGRRAQLAETGARGVQEHFTAQVAARDLDALLRRAVPADRAPQGSG